LVRLQSLAPTFLCAALAIACGTKRHPALGVTVPDERPPGLDGPFAPTSPGFAVVPVSDVDLEGDPGVLVVGRTAEGQHGRRFAWPGTHFKARFLGSSVSVELRDEDHENAFEVLIDGQRHSKLITTADQHHYELAHALPHGVHEVLLWRRTEATYGATEFVGFDDFGEGGRLLSPPQASDRVIEVIGDSTTLGFGNEGKHGCKGDKDNQNSYLAYGSVAARAVGADVVTIAWSGVGLYRNFDEDGPSADTMTPLYEYAVLDEPREAWTFSGYEPQVVVIALGNNDYSTRGDPGPPYVEAYTDFARRVRDAYPNAEIICLIQREAMIPNVEEVVEILRTAGDTHVESFDIRVDHGRQGCDGHPSVERHAVLGEKLAGELRRLMAW